MKNKPCDKDYCGCNVLRIRNAQVRIDPNMFLCLAYWIRERYSIHLKKDVYSLAAPWTMDKILQQYRFTNVRREHDKETRWLIDNVCLNESLSPETKLTNIIFFRMINKSQTVKEFMPIHSFSDMTEIRQAASILSQFPKEYSLFSNAFLASGLKRTCNRIVGKQDNAAISCLLCCAMQDLYQKVNMAVSEKESAEELYKHINSILGLGAFLSYQIFVDWTYCPESVFSENCFVVAGPGAKKGLELIFVDAGGMTYEEQLFWLRDNWKQLSQWLGVTWSPEELFIDLLPEDRVMNVMSLQNCMCELSKYVRAFTGSGRPRTRYYGG